MEALIYIVLGFLSSLFIIYSLSKDDFVLLRKNISLEQVFDLALMVGLFAILSSRFFYAFLSSKTIFLNPVIFISFPYFPGFSLTGGVAGGVLFFIYFCLRRKLPFFRLFDIFSTALIFSIGLGFLFLSFINLVFERGFIAREIILLIVFLILTPFYLKLFIRSKFNDGFLGVIFLMFFSILFLLKNLPFQNFNTSYLLKRESIMLFLLLFSSLIFLVKERKTLLKVKKY